MKTESISFSEKEKQLIEQYAQQHGMTFEAAASDLFSKGLARRVKKRTGKTPSKNILQMQRT